MKTEKLCQVCQKNSSKYTCPGCEIKFCSVNCCKQHKIQTKCTGERDKTKFIELSKFTDQDIRSGKLITSINFN